MNCLYLKNNSVYVQYPPIPSRYLTNILFAENDGSDRAPGHFRSNDGESWNAEGLRKTIPKTDNLFRVRFHFYSIVRRCNLHLAFETGSTDAHQIDSHRCRVHPIDFNQRLRHLLLFLGQV